MAHQAAVIVFVRVLTIGCSMHGFASKSAPVPREIRRWYVGGSNL
jgi:hypothetical protein